jgi:hypothetical protein
MKGGDKNAVNVVPRHTAGKVLTTKYLEDLENSVRGRTPVAGQNIAITYLDGSAVISVTGTLGGGEPFPLTICSNGTPSVVTVLTVI